MLIRDLLMHLKEFDADMPVRVMSEQGLHDIVQFQRGILTHHATGEGELSNYFHIYGDEAEVVFISIEVC